MLKILGWEFLRQEEKIVQGRLEKPDFLLFSSGELKEEYISIPKESRAASNAIFDVILEAKACSIPIDNKKIKGNPHFQILRYLSSLKKDYGFLSNGCTWCFLDNSKLTSTKVFYEIDLEAILEMDAEEALEDSLVDELLCKSRHIEALIEISL